MLYGDFPFHSNSEDKMEKEIINYRYELKKTISESAKDLLSKILSPANIRIGLDEIRKHPWMIDIDPSSNI